MILRVPEKLDDEDEEATRLPGLFIRLCRIPRLRTETHSGVQARPWPWRNALMRDIPFQRSIYHASADFAHRRMTHQSLGVGGYGFGGPRACPWGSMA